MEMQLIQTTIFLPLATNKFNRKKNMKSSIRCKIVLINLKKRRGSGGGVVPDFPGPEAGGFIF